MKKPWIWIGAAAFLALGALFFLRSGRAESRSSELRRPPAVRRADYLEIVGRPVRFSAARGERRRYRFHSEYRVQVDVGVGSTQFLLRAEGDLTERIYEAGLHGLQFRPLQVVALGPKGDPVGDYEGLRPELETETLVHRDAEGRTTSLRFAREIGSDARNFLRGILGALEVIVPAGNSGRWGARGEDSTGRYVAEYATLFSSDDEVRLSRRKKYEELYLQGSLAQTEKASTFDLMSGGESLLVLDSCGRLRSIEGNESLQVQGRTGESCVRVRSESVIRVTLLEACIDEEVLRAGNLARETNAFDGYLPEAMALRRVSVGDKAMSELLADLSRAVERGTWAQEAPLVFLSLKELLADSEEARAAAGSLLRSGSLSTEVLQTLADALGSSPFGWRELIPLAADPALRTAAIQALGLTPQPTAEVIQALAAWSRSEDHAIAEAAVDSMGLAAGLPTNRAERDAVASELATLLGRSSEQDARVIRALGNAGSERTLDVVLARADAADPEVRASVAGALRKYGGTEAWNAAVKLVSDPSPDVRANAVGTLARRSEPQAYELLAKVARNDSDENVRREALEPFAGDRDMMLHAATHDPSASVRAWASGQIKTP